MRILLHTITIMIIQCGIYIWCNAVWSEAWISAYYIWDKSVMLLLVLCCINPVKAMFPFWVITGIFFAVRLLAEFVAVFTDISHVLFDFKLLFSINLLCTVLVIRNVLKCPK